MVIIGQDCRLKLKGSHTKLVTKYICIYRYIYIYIFSIHQCVIITGVPTKGQKATRGCSLFEWDQKSQIYVIKPTEYESVAPSDTKHTATIVDNTNDFCG